MRRSETPLQEETPSPSPAALKHVSISSFSLQKHVVALGVESHGLMVSLSAALTAQSPGPNDLHYLPARRDISGQIRTGMRLLHVTALDELHVA